MNNIENIMDTEMKAIKKSRYLIEDAHASAEKIINQERELSILMNDIQELNQ